MLNLAKWGSVRFNIPFGIRFPLIICCPTQAIICETLILEPLLPHACIIIGEL